MEAFAIYFLKSVIWLTGFALVYFLFLKNERFFHLNRFYLVAGILISFIFPLFTVHYQVELSAPDVSQTINLTPAGNVSAAVPQQAGYVNKFDYRFVLLALYLSGVLFFAFRMLKCIRSLFKSIDRAKFNSLDQAKLIRASEFKSSFSFFNYIFINPSVGETEMEEILNHEMVHVNQKHWVDLLLVELLRLFQWINPVAWIYSGFIRQNHEYIADEAALQQAPDPAVYKAVLVNQLFDSRVISFSNSFNYSLNKKRFDMMKEIIVSPYRKMKVLLVLPVFAIIFYAFATPEYHYSATTSDNTVKIDQAETTVLTENTDSPGKSKASGMQTTVSQPPVDQKTVRGIVLKDDGQPLERVNIMSTGNTGNASSTTTGRDGRYELNKVQPDASLLFSCPGYKGLVLKADFTKEMSVIMEKDPEYKGSVIQRQSPLAVIDGEITDKNYMDALKELGYNLGIVKQISGKEATDKYGEKGANGVMELTTRNKALEMGLKPEYFPRLSPEDYPTFQNQKWNGFRAWVTDNVKYPPEAQARKIEGWITANFTVELDGTVSNPVVLGSVDPVLSDEVIRVIKSSPKWEPPKNPAVDMPFTSSVNIGFKLPDQIVKEEPFVVVEEMPMYPGGEGELLKFLAENTQYPEAAKAQNIAGKVIIRFIVNTEGDSEGMSVLKGVHPLLDAEAVKVVGMLSGFKPGMQGGKAVPVWYMVPITFALPITNQP